jgi:uncharacterized protein YdhG (YjbR/CyaY superfamily)
MKPPKPDHEGVDAYIASFPEAIQRLLTALRHTVRKVAPDAIEKLSYKMPTYYQEGNLLYFAAFKDHVSIFPGVQAVIAFEKKTANYRTSKGTIQFPLDEPLPIKLIEEVVRYRVKERKRKK